MTKAIESLGIGIIGYGGFGQFLHRAWAGMDGVEVRAVADSNPTLREVVAVNASRFAEANAVGTAGTTPRRREATSDVTFYSNWRDLLGNRDVAIVSIATPPFKHADMACSAMHAGKHVLIEKPLATTRDDALRICAVAEKTSRIAAVNYMLRFNPIVEAMQAWARDGSFGALRRVIVENYAQDESLSRHHWFWDHAKSGGILVEHAVHFIDLVHGCTEAERVSVDGLALERTDGRIDRMGLTAVFADGLVTQQYHAFSRPGFFEDTWMRFVFDLAQVDIEGWIPLRGRVTALVNGRTIGELEKLPGLEVHQRTPLTDVADASRPVGWGGASDGRASDAPVTAASAVSAAASASADATDAGAAESADAAIDTDAAADPMGGRRDWARDVLHSGGVPYHVGEQIRGEFALPVPKAAAYADALRSMMADVVAAVRDPTHRPRAGLIEGLRSLDVALAATELATKER